MSLYLQARQCEHRISNSKQQLNELHQLIKSAPAMDQPTLTLFQQKITTLEQNIQRYKVLISQIQEKRAQQTPWQRFKELKDAYNFCVDKLKECTPADSQRKHLLSEAYLAQKRIFENQTILLESNCFPPQSQETDPQKVLLERAHHILLNNQAIAAKFSHENPLPNAGQKRKAEAEALSEPAPAQKMVRIGNLRVIAEEAPPSVESVSVSASEERPKKTVQFHPVVAQLALQVRTRDVKALNPVALNDQEKPYKKYDGEAGGFYKKPLQERLPYQTRFQEDPPQ